MKIQVYDPPMCCSSGLCGLNVKPELVSFANDLKWLEQQGVAVERFNLASAPASFMSQEAVKKALHDEGNDCLPLIVANDSIVSKGIYPSRSQLMKIVGIENEKGNDGNANATQTEDAAACGPECSCGTDEIKTEPESNCGPDCCCNSNPSPLSKKLKTGLFVVILLAVVGVFIYKNNTQKNEAKNQAAKNSSTFAVATPEANVKSKAAQGTVATSAAGSQATTEKSDEPSRKIGTNLDSLSSLDKVALSQDAVFIFIPSPKNENADESTSKAVNSVKQTLKTKNITLGLYTLPSSSPDYARLAAQVQAPAILVAYKVNHKRVRRLQKGMRMRTIYPRPKFNTSVPAPENRKYPYLLRGLEIERPNQVWATDITYTVVEGKRAFVIAIIDLFSRRVMGYKTTNTMEANNCVEVLDFAMRRYGKPEIFNSDQGSQFTSTEFTEVLIREGILISMDGRGRCLDNAKMERFWWSLKYEDIKLKDYESLNALRLGVQSYVNFYNRRRNHTALPGFQTPDEVYFKGCNLQSKAV